MEIIPELSVRDLAAAQDMLVRVFGFAPEDGVLRLGDQRIVLVPAEGPGGHGGIDHLALKVNDTDQALAGLVQRGAVLDATTPNGPQEIAEFWDNGVRYVFLQGPEGARIELCARRGAPEQAGLPGHDHIGLPCSDIAASEAFFLSLGLKPTGRFDLIRPEGTIAVRFLAAGDSVVELYAPPGHDPSQTAVQPSWRGLRLIGAGRQGQLTGPDGLSVTLV